MNDRLPGEAFAPESPRRTDSDFDRLLRARPSRWRRALTWLLNIFSRRG